MSAAVKDTSIVDKNDFLENSEAVQGSHQLAEPTVADLQAQIAAMQTQLVSLQHQISLDVAENSHWSVLYAELKLARLHLSTHPEG